MHAEGRDGKEWTSFIALWVFLDLVRLHKSFFNILCFIYPRDYIIDTFVYLFPNRLRTCNRQSTHTVHKNRTNNRLRCFLSARFHGSDYYIFNFLASSVNKKRRRPQVNDPRWAIGWEGLELDYRLAASLARSHNNDNNNRCL